MFEYFNEKKISLKNNFIPFMEELRNSHQGDQMFGEEILTEIDGTLDQLIRNAEVIQRVDLKDLSETEIDAFQKTQESLLHHLMHMDQFLVTKRTSLKLQDKRSASYKIQEKLLRFEQMKSSYHKNFAELQKKVAVLSKRRGKRLLEGR